ncbi:unnamed protein product [Penicillium bialowiezense]
MCKRCFQPRKHIGRARVPIGGDQGLGFTISTEVAKAEDITQCLSSTWNIEAEPPKEGGSTFNANGVGLRFTIKLWFLYQLMGAVPELHEATTNPHRASQLPDHHRPLHIAGRIPGPKIVKSSECLASLEARLIPVDHDNLTVIQSTGELTHFLGQKLQRPILWRQYTHTHPLRELPYSIPDILDRIESTGCKTLETYDLRKPVDDRNHATPLAVLKAHFASPGNVGIKCLDIRNTFGPSSPAHIHRVDALRLALQRQVENPSKATPLPETGETESKAE